MGIEEGWLDFREGTSIPSGLAVDRDNRLYIALRARPEVDARTVGGTEVLVYAPDRRRYETMRLTDTAQVHAISIVDDTMLVTDRGAHCVRRYTLDGRSLGVLGSPDRPSDTGCPRPGGPVPHAAGPFNGPTQAVVAGDRTYVTDGYCNARLHAFTPDGRTAGSWGAYGEDVGRLKLPHSLAVLSDRLLVCDRENSRIQSFSLDGAALGVWWEVHRPTDVVVHGPHVYVVDLSARVTKLDTEANVLASWPVRRSAHNLCVDAAGRVYVTHILIQGMTVITEDPS